MLTEIKLPVLGENIKSGIVAKVSVAPGQSVNKDQTLIELETEKATVEIPCPSQGTVKEIRVREGQEITVGQVLVLLETSESPSTAQAEKPEGKPVSAKPPQAASAPPKPLASEEGPKSTSETSQAQSDVPAAPSVRVLAKEIGVDLTRVSGTGQGGRISLEDVRAFAKKLITERSPAPANIPSTSLPDFTLWGAVERVPLNLVRRTAAERLSMAWTTIPHVTQFGEADMTLLEELRQRHSVPDRKLSILPFMMKVVASALKIFPQFNASIDMASHELIYKKYIHIGFAVDTPNGLLVPVIRDVDQKNILSLAKEISDLARRAREKKITLEDMQGGTMTITNLGGIGGTHFTPIINWPEVAILGLSRAQIKVQYQENHFVPRLMLPLSLSYDHRAVDGADAARLITWIIEAIQQPLLLELGE